ncbi:hypothetical protein HKD37_08G023163 [Glycine soja]
MDKMLPRALLAKFILKPSTRALHSRNKKALEFIAKGWNALKEVDRVIDYSDPKHSGIVSLLRTAKENFELALEADNTNTHARYWLSRLHMKYPVPGANKAVGAALLVEAAEMGDPEAQYALGCHLRVEKWPRSSNSISISDMYRIGLDTHIVSMHHSCAILLDFDDVHIIEYFGKYGDPENSLVLFYHLFLQHFWRQNDYVQSDQQAFYYLEKAVDQLHPGALYLLGAVYLTGDCVRKDIASALWCFHRASEKGHAGAAIAYGSLLLKGVEVPESVIKFSLTRGAAAHRRGRNKGALAIDPVEMAREKFQIAAKAGCELGFKWLARLEEEEKRALTGEH